VGKFVERLAFFKLPLMGEASYEESLTSPDMLIADASPLQMILRACENTVKI
jgi:hypothetical protein